MSLRLVPDTGWRPEFDVAAESPCTVCLSPAGRPCECPGRGPGGCSREYDPADPHTFPEAAA